jgi:hypothetical protein
MKSANRIIPKYYDGYAKYSSSKLLWSRIKVPAKRFKPTYVLIRKGGYIIGGAVLTRQNIYLTKFSLKVRIGIIHEIFLDKEKFKTDNDLYLGHFYLLDKIIRAATRRFLGMLLFKSTVGDNDLNKALMGYTFLKSQDTVAMVKELKEDIKFPKLKKPIHIPTYITLGFP